MYFAIIALEIFSNLVDDAIVIARAGFAIWVHWDLYNVSIIAGKIIKIIF